MFTSSEIQRLHDFFMTNSNSHAMVVTSLYFLLQHRTGCLVGCLRKLQNWCMSAVVEEYKHFAGTKWRETDLKFLESYDVSCIRHCLESIIYRYYGAKKRRLLYSEESLQKPQMTSVL